MARVYISSTYEDLREYRLEVLNTLRRMQQEVIAMEEYAAADERPLAKCLLDVGTKHSVRTDKNGAFRLAFLLPGNYKVTASMRGYLDTTISIEVHLTATVQIVPPDITPRRADSNSRK